MVIQNILLSCALIVIIETAFIKPIITGWERKSTMIQSFRFPSKI
jgi:hypothetical protein